MAIKICLHGTIIMCVFDAGDVRLSGERTANQSLVRGKGLL